LSALGYAAARVGSDLAAGVSSRSRASASSAAASSRRSPPAASKRRTVICRRLRRPRRSAPDATPFAGPGGSPTSSTELVGGALAPSATRRPLPRRAPLGLGRRPPRGSPSGQRRRHEV
uniref:Uncharacterized protein n=1 Tax=Aegilops tauschii subsp. strangulata TaxID=200361 RepID=A0A453DHR2_AEGTS